MVKLTPELIEESRIFVNPCQDRELDLRNYKIPIIESLGATYNQFDNIDLTDNDLRRLENFPLLPRLKTLFLSNNRIAFLDPTIGENIKNVHTVVLTNNSLAELGDCDPLASLPKLEYLSLMGNPVCHKSEYRLYLIHKLPKLRVLDYRRIRQKEREAAKTLFKGKKGKALVAQLGKRSAIAEEDAPVVVHRPPTRAEDVQRIKAAIAKAGSLQEVERLQEMLSQGQIPGEETRGHKGTAEEEEEEMES